MIVKMNMSSVEQCLQNLQLGHTEVIGKVHSVFLQKHGVYWWIKSQLYTMTTTCNHMQTFSFIRLGNIHESENYDSDITGLHIGPDEISYLESAKVPEGSSDECEALANDLWSYGQSHPVPAVVISKQTAAEYSQGLEGRAGMIN